MQSGMGCDGAGVERNGVLRYKGVFFFSNTHTACHCIK
jgi:hypothetical protein